MALLLVAERFGRRALRASGIQSRFVETKLARQHVYDGGGGGPLPTVVVLHGISSSATPFAGVLRRLRPHVRRVVAPEAPGHGFSGQPRESMTPENLADATIELLDKELTEPAIVFGNSLGGALAFRYAIARPERVRGLFLASPAGATMAPADLEVFLRTFHLGSSADARAFMSRLYHKDPWFSPFIAGDVKRMFSREVIRSFTSSVRPEHSFTREDLAALSMPVHLLWGRSERLMPQKHLDFFKANLPPHAIVEEPEGFGHCPHIDDPKGLCDRILAFARRATELG
jgi:pimeloyl-ACP methyl ester carboxylesterase